MKNPTHIKQNTVLASVLALFTFTITAQTFGPYGGNSFANVALSDSSVKWNNSSYVTNLNDRLQATSSAAISTAGAYSSYLVVNNFNLALDPQSTILGISIEENRMTFNTHNKRPLHCSFQKSIAHPQRQSQQRVMGEHQHFHYIRFFKRYLGDHTDRCETHLERLWRRIFGRKITRRRKLHNKH